MHPQMMRSETVHEIVVERYLCFQFLDAFAQAVLVVGEKNRVHQT